MTAKTDLPPVPPALEDVALIDGPTCAAVNNLSISAWHDGVRRTRAGELRAGEVPYPLPVIQQPRYTRWRLVDLRSYMTERAAHGRTSQGQDAARTARAKAAAASQAARTKRNPAAAASKAA